MKKKHCIILSLCFITILASCKSTKTSTERVNNEEKTSTIIHIKEQPSAIIHIADDSFDSDYKLSKVNKITIQKLKTENDAIKVPAGKKITLHFEKSSTTSNTNTQGETFTHNKTADTYSWSAESSKTTVSVTTTTQKIIFDCPELKENQEYTVFVSAKGFELKENNSFTLITEGKF